LRWDVIVVLAPVLQQTRSHHGLPTGDRFKRGGRWCHTTRLAEARRDTSGSGVRPCRSGRPRTAGRAQRKRALAHGCADMRGEMAHHQLKTAGCNVGFVKAGLEIDKNGKLTIKS
jgi:hypothetical protein